MIEQEEQPIVDSLVRDHMVVIQDEDNFPRVLHEFIEQGRQDGREWGGLLRVQHGESRLPHPGQAGT